MYNKIKKEFEVIHVAQHHVACDGDGAALGHPRVWLSLDNPEHRITCPYCSRTYVLSVHGHGTHSVA
jgi:uncharacterized Zn-finger protein